MGWDWIKTVHVSSVTLSLTLFALRSFWVVRRADILQQRWLRVLPHVVDTVLLASGIGLVITRHLYPTLPPWLTVKLVTMAVYIVLAYVAMRYIRQPVLQIGALLVAVLLFLYIISVARFRHPLWFL